MKHSAAFGRNRRRSNAEAAEVQRGLKMVSEVSLHVILSAAKNLSLAFPIRSNRREILRCAQNDTVSRPFKSSLHLCVSAFSLPRPTRPEAVTALFFFLWLALFAGALPASAQDEEPTSNEPFFQISSQQTYAPAQEPKVEIRFRQVDHLDFRIYRVKDPIQFFAKLRDAHSFGSEKQELAHALTWLERFHAWKRDLRLEIREFFRSQLRYDTRHVYHETRLAQQKQKRIKLDVAAYAQVPLLNREQLVTSWRELLPKTRGDENQEIPVDLHRKGLFLVEVANRELRAYTLLMITDVAMVSKGSPGQMMLFVANRTSGAPVAGATAVIFNNHQEAARGTTDAFGVYEAALEKTKLQDAFIVAKAGDDVAATSMESFYFFDQSATDYVGYIYTDRPVYRPTHEVDFKGILRARRAGQYSPEINQPVKVEIQDPNQKTVYQQTIALSAFGSFHGTLTLSPLAALGYYQIVAHIGDAVTSGSFEVQEYKKPEFEVSVSTDKARYLQGETIQATVNARYYFGAPVAHGKVKYSVYRSGYMFPYWQILWGSEDYEADDEGGEDFEGGYYGEEIKQGTGQLDANGLLSIQVPAEVNSNKRDYRYRIEAHVTDASNREIMGGRGVLATYSTVVVLLDTDRYVYRPGDEAGVTVHTVDYDSHPVSTSVQLSFYFNEQGGWSWRAPQENRKLLAQASVTTDANGVAHYAYTVPQEPWIMVEATATDSNHREASFDAGLWISGVQYAWEGQTYRRPDIILDKHSYKPGDTAHVLISTHAPGAQILVTTEGQQVYSWKLYQVEGDSITVDVPIEERYEPNFFIGVTFVQKEQLYEVTKNVAVPAAEKVLKVTVETDKPQYRPDEKVTYTVTAVDQQGKPVSAEVSLGVVDEAIYAIRPDAVQPPEKEFYAKTWNRVSTDFSTVYWFTGYSGKQKMQLTWLRAATRLADFKNPSQVVQPQVRKYFPDTIYWMPSLVTDAAGKATATFTFPDSLTTWRATARAATKDTLVGQVTQKVITRKNLILRLDVPRFLTQGDTLTVTGIVHNYLETDKTARVSLGTTGVELKSASEISVNVPKNGEAVVTWTVQTSKIGQADFLGKALTNEESDALELAIPVRPWGLQLNSALSGSLREEKAETTQTIALPADINPDASSLRLDLAPSVAGTLMSALDFLATYPYGCVEQTMSSFLPNILVAQAVKDLGLTAPPASVELQQKIAAGLQRLYQFQHDDGGWGWWETDQTHPFMTAYVVAGLAQAKAAGYAVDEGRLERGRESLIEQIGQNPRALADIRAYLIYALEMSVEPGLNLAEAFEKTRQALPPSAEQRMRERSSEQNGPSTATVNPKWVDGLDQGRAKLSPYGQALMAQALARMKDTRAQEFVRALEESAKTEGPYVWWKSERQAMLDFSSDNSFETTAYAVNALSDLDPKSDLLPKAARWLIDRRSDGYYWFSTEQTATAISGLIDYLKVSGELKPNYTLQVFVNGQKLAERQVTEKDVQNPQPITLTASTAQLHAGGNAVRLVKSGPGVLYWSAFASYYKREPQPPRVGSVALNVVREYFKLAPEKLNGRIVYTEQPLSGAVQSGDVVVVRLTVTATGDEQYLQIEDPIPAGFEFIEQEDAYELKQRPPWWDFYYTYREFHDDRAALFSTTFRRGQGQFHYLLKAVEPGTFQANPARVLPMYEPARQASTQRETIVIAPQDKE